MGTGDRYRLIIVISFILLIICSFFLLISIWNNLSLNPEIHSGPGMYLLVAIIIFLASVIFVMHLFEEREFSTSTDNHEDIPGSTVDLSGETAPEPYKAPFEVDIDEIAEAIIPRINKSESLEDYAESILLNMARQFEFVQGIIYMKDPKTQEFRSVSTYAYTSETEPPSFKAGDGIPGQVAKNKTMMNLSSLPEGYLQVQSGLGKTSPDNLLIIPLLLNKETIGIIELASFRSLDKETEWTFKNLARIISNAFVTKLKSAGKK
jgi:hypothetical protein